MNDNAKVKRPAGAVQDVLAGAIAGAVALSNTVTYGVLIFSGLLAGYVSLGIGLALFSGFALALVVALTSRAAGVIAFPQSAVAPIMALLAVSIAADLQGQASTEAIMLTVVAGLWLSALLTAILFLIFGRFKLGGLIRFMPYPVFGGFLAGLGWLMFRGGLTVMLGTDSAASLLDAGALLYWLPGVLYGLAILYVQRRFKHPLAVPLMLVGGWALFFAAALGLGLSFGEVESQGWLLGPFPQGFLWQPVIFRAFGQADWRGIFHHTGTIVTISMTSLLGSLLNFSGIELATRQTVDLDRNLQGAGWANFAASLGGGMVGYHSASISILAHRLGARSRLAGIAAAGVFGIALLFGASVLSLLPKLVVGGVLVYAGLVFLVRWVWETRLTLPLTDYLTLLVILLVIVGVGLLEGVALGLVITVGMFVVNYSRIDVVRHSLSGANFRSNVDRPGHHLQELHEAGRGMLILKLQGFVFFGTASRLLADIQKRVEDPARPPLKFVVLDFRLINGIDSSALSSFTQIQILSEMNQFALVFTGLSESLTAQLRRGMDDQSESAIRFFADLDRGVEWCEDRILGEERITGVGRPRLEIQLTEAFHSRRAAEQFMQYLEREEIPAGVTLIEQGDPPAGMYFVQAGKITARLELADGSTLRLRTMGAGTIVGELGLYLNHIASATVITEEPSVVYRLAREQLARMEQTTPAIAALFHKYIASILGERLTETNHTLRALLE
jgi:SulP family sulfate permease